MKALVYHTYGSPDVLRMEEIEKPTIMDDEVLVKVDAASVNAGDWLRLEGKDWLTRMIVGGIRTPKNKILGADMAGRIEAVGSSVTRFKVGDIVYGEVSTSRMGSFAEYVAVPERYIALKPARLSPEEAAAVPVAGLTALQGLRDKGKVQPGQKVLITGAAGGVGSFAVQLAKYFGADVTATCSASKMDLVRSIGADDVLDYKRVDVTRIGQLFDLILDNASYRPFLDFAPVLNPGGIYVLVGGSIPDFMGKMALMPLASLRGTKKYRLLAEKPNYPDLDVMREILETGKVMPVIDRCYPLSEAGEALRYFGEGRVRGKIAITVAL